MAVSAKAVEAALLGFIAGVAVVSVIGWFLRDRIRASDDPQAAGQLAGMQFAGDLP